MTSSLNERSASGFRITCGGAEIRSEQLVSFFASLDLGQPDMCSVTVRNDTNELSNSVSLGATLEVTAEGAGAPIFKGDVATLHPVYEAKGKNVIVVQAFNVLHRLLRRPRSQTFAKQTDAQIVERIVRRYSLEPKCGERAQMLHEHVYQHNQNDLTFLRLRAARLGYDLWVEYDERGKEILRFDEPDACSGPAVKLRYGDAKSAVDAMAKLTGDGPPTLFLKRFAPRLSSVGILEKVVVQGWDPKKKESIEEHFTFNQSRMGKKMGNTLLSALPGFANYSDPGELLNSGSGGGQAKQIVSYEVDNPVQSIQEAQAIAESKFRDAAMGYIQGDGECRGSPKIRPGVMVDIQVNPDGQDRFNGKYLITGATHRYLPTQSSDAGGYITDIRVRRDAEG